MRSLRQLNSNLSLFLLAFGGALILHPAAAATLCTDLPSSALRIYDIKALAVEVVEVSGEELDRSGQGGDLASRHSLMLSMSDLVVSFQITHRVMAREDGSVCDAPSLVRLNFGSSRRLAFLARAAAADDCVRQQMLEHEAAHNSALNEVIDRFIEQQQSNLQRGMAVLKQTPAPDEKIAEARWERGLHAIATKIKDQLLTEIRSANARIDESSALAALESACGGKIRQLQQRSG